MRLCTQRSLYVLGGLLDELDLSLRGHLWNVGVNPPARPWFRAHVSQGGQVASGLNCPTRQFDFQSHLPIFTSSRVTVTIAPCCQWYMALYCGWSKEARAFRAWSFVLGWLWVLSTYLCTYALMMLICQQCGQRDHPQCSGDPQASWLQGTVLGSWVLN